jgi:acyl-CoA synthetase (AMP-forming)/AMP-acid ligase II
VEITQGLHRAVQQGPDAPATVFMGRTRTWAESAERIARLAGALRGLGVQPGDRVAILSANSDIYHEFMFAACWIGAAFVPVNTRWSVAEIAFSLEDAGTAVLLVDENFASLVPELRAQAPVLKDVLFDGNGSGPDDASSVEERIADGEPVADVRRGGDSLAAIFYTGGTTGVPKGVMLSHDNLIVSALGSMASGHWTRPGATYLHAAPMFHAADISGWIAVNLVGGTHVFAPRFGAGAVARMIEQHRVTDTILVPTMIQMLVDSPESAHADMSSLQRLMYGGSPISGALIERTAARLPGTRLTQTYAMTEMSPVMTVLGPEEHHDPLLRSSGGRAAPHVELRIVDEDDNDLPPGATGRIVARGGGRMLGYWNRPEETAEALANGWMHTGDAGYLDDDGYLFVIDRVKDMIISGGENVYSTEVENALATHSGVGMCAVIGVPDPRWGERVHAVVLPATGVRATEEELRRHVRERIAGYKVPRSFEFVDSMPLSGAGKILKRELRARHWNHEERDVS